MVESPIGDQARCNLDSSSPEGTQVAQLFWKHACNREVLCRGISGLPDSVYVTYVSAEHTFLAETREGTAGRMEVGRKISLKYMGYSKSDR